MSLAPTLTCRIDRVLHGVYANIFIAGFGFQRVDERIAEYGPFPVMSAGHG